MRVSTAAVVDHLSEILENVGDILDITPDLYEAAVAKYTEVGAFLDAPDSDLSKFRPRIYPQGSFRLGTMIRPWSREDEYDIDLVCVLDIVKEHTSQVELKSRVGRRLGQNPDYAEILKELGRCWRLRFSKRFHLDVLPSIPDREDGPPSILLTDKDLVRWQHSNPIGYADWFYARMSNVLVERRVELAATLNLSVDDVPVWRVRTPLQRAVQILKRHRDLYFQHDQADKPASILITTLAGYGYSGARTVVESLLTIVDAFERIEVRDGVAWVPNPAHPKENFADKWRQFPDRRKKFVGWVQSLKTDLGRLLATEGIDGISLAMTPMLGESVSRDAVGRYGQLMRLRRERGVLSMAPRSGLLAGTTAISGGVKVKAHTFYGGR